MTTTPIEQVALWADQLRAMSAHGLHYVDNAYDAERYQQIMEIALAMVAFASGETMADLEPLRGTVIIDDQERLLLIRRADNGLWAMPGGALEVGETPAEGVVREALEEAGVYSEAVGLVGIFDSRFCGTKSRHHLYQITFLCRPLDKAPTQPSHAHETLETAWFTEAELPDAIDPGHSRRIPIAFQIVRGERQPFFDRA